MFFWMLQIRFTGKHTSEPLSSCFCLHHSWYSFICSTNCCSVCWPYSVLFYFSSAWGNYLSFENSESGLFWLHDYHFYLFLFLNWIFFKLFIHCLFYVGRASFRRLSTVLHGNNAVVCLCFKWNPWYNQSLMFFVQTLTLKCCQYRLTCHEVERDTQRDKCLCSFNGQFSPNFYCV